MEEFHDMERHIQDVSHHADDGGEAQMTRGFDLAAYLNDQGMRDKTFLLKTAS